MTFPVLASNGPSGYNLSRSLRTRASASAYLNRTPASASNRQTFTISTWVKRGKLGATGYFFAADNGSNGSAIYFTSADQLQFYDYVSGSYQFQLATTQTFRDPSAWYHILFVSDTTQATASNRIKMYVNGVQVTAFSTSTYPSQNYNNSSINNANIHYIGYLASSFDGYTAETYLIDGQALTPSSFGSTNTLTGVWQPAPYTGTYGTNGFYLPFTDNSALTTSSNAGLGKDFSGNGNYWATNNISITAGATYDSMTDVPTLTSPTAANFAVLNPLQNGGTLSGANLNYAVPSTAEKTVFGTMALPPTQKIYFEVTYVAGTGAGSYASVGIATSALGLSTAAGTVTGSWAIESNQASDSINRNQGSATSYGAGTYFSTGQVCMVAIDQASGKIWYGKNGTWFSSGDPAAGTNAAATNVSTTATLFPVATSYATTPSLAFNFGQRPFAYTPPTGFVALNTFNLPTSTIVKGNTVMDATLYTGNSSTQTVTNAGAFKPDLVWIKDRSSVAQHVWTDSVRGVDRQLFSSLTNAEQTSATGITSLNSNGFSLGVNVSPTGNTNGSPDNFVAWQWQAGQGTTSTNTAGTITSTVSVNASAGFSVVTFTGNGSTSSGQTIGHGLGVTPAFIVTKKRSSGTTDYGWSSWHKDLGGNYGIWLDKTSARNASMWAGYTNINSSVFSPPDKDYGNESGQTYVAYLWTPIAGYSSIGSYVGNGSSDGPMVYTGFKPRFLLIKKITTGGGDRGWLMEDTARSPYNAAELFLYANASDAESNNQQIDFLSNGFKIRNNGLVTNDSGITMIYAAFAENPFKNALAR